MNATIQRHRGAVVVAFPLKTTNPNNGSQGFSKGAAMAKARRRKKQRKATERQMLAARPLPPLPVAVTVTRIAPSKGLDRHDGLGAALKGVIDGVADALGLKDDSDKRVTFATDQRRGPARYFGVEIRVEVAG